MVKYINPEVAETILQQLGGIPRLNLFIGAWDFKISENGVEFRFLSNPEMNLCQIVLDPDYTYSVYFCQVQGKEREVIRAYDNIYNEDLMDLFEETTNLYLTMNSRK